MIRKMVVVVAAWVADCSDAWRVKVLALVEQWVWSSRHSPSTQSIVE